MEISHIADGSVVAASKFAGMVVSHRFNYINNVFFFMSGVAINAAFGCVYFICSILDDDDRAATFGDTILNLVFVLNN